MKTMQPNAEVTQALKTLHTTRGATTKFAKLSKVDTTTIRKIRQGQPVAPRSLQKVSKALSKDPSKLPMLLEQIGTPIPPVNSLKHLEAFSGALMDGMEFMRLQILRYLNGA